LKEKRNMSLQLIRHTNGWTDRQTDIDRQTDRQTDYAQVMLKIKDTFEW